MSEVEKDLNLSDKIPFEYKQSALGVIPKEWNVIKLGNFINIVSGVSPTNLKLLDKGKYPYLKVEDLNNCKKYQVSSREYSNDEKYLVPINSIIFPKRGGAILNNKIRINKSMVQMDSNLMAIYPKSEDLNYHYLYHNINYQNLSKIADTSSIPQINNKHIVPYPFLIPPIEEQKRIAGVLDKADESLQIVQQKLKQMEIRKKWLMQQLLTGKKRLNGFEDEWKEIHIKDVASEITHRNKLNNDYIVLSCTKYDGLVPSLEYFGRKIFSNDLTTYKIVPKYHFAYATNHIEEGSLGYQSSLANALISPMYTVFKTDEKLVCDKFFYRLLKSHHMIYQYQNRMEGSIDRRGGLRWNAFSIIRINLPLLDEQVAINNILEIADKEIKLLKEKVEKLKEQKKGLMQVLLTGKKRLK